MQNVSKQFGGKATGSLSGQFHSARVRLTFVYVVILAAILFVSSYTIYSDFSSRFQDRFERIRHEQQVAPPFANAVRPQLPSGPTPEEVRDDLIRSLLMVNGLLLIVAGIVSYGLAGLTLEPIQEAYNRQLRFLGDASHELRTPLAILQTDLENELEGPKINAESRERAESHLEEVERMGRLVSDLLMLSRLDEHSKTTAKVEEWQMDEVVAAAVQRFQPIAKQHGISLSYVGGDKAVLKASKELFLQALDNVIKNAILYNVENGTVTLSVARDKSTAKVTVSDTGVGIPRKDLERIFDRFYRADSSRSRTSGGSGLGLAIVKSAIERLGGSVIVKSKPGKGTEITLSLPLHNSFTTRLVG